MFRGPQGSVKCRYEVLEIVLHNLLSSDTTRTAQNTTPTTILRSRWKVFSEQLPSNDRDIHLQSHRHTRSAILLSVFVVAEVGMLVTACVRLNRVKG